MEEHKEKLFFDNLFSPTAATILVQIFSLRECSVKDVDDYDDYDDDGWRRVKTIRGDSCRAFMEEFLSLLCQQIHRRADLAHPPRGHHTAPRGRTLEVVGVV